MKDLATILTISALASSSAAIADSIPEVTANQPVYISDNPWVEDDTYAWRRQMAEQYYAEQARRQNAAREAANAQAKKEAEARKKYKKCKAVAAVNYRFCMDTLHKNNSDAVEFCNNLSLGLSVATINPLVSGMVDANVGVCRSTRAARYLELQSECELDFSLDNLECTDHL